MRDVIDWGLLILAFAIVAWFVILLFKVFFADKTYPKEIKIALIGAAATVLTILGAVKTTRDTNASNAALQRAAEVSRIKQQYYTGFFEAFWKKNIVSHTEPKNHTAQMEAAYNLSIEYGRLPLYASQDFVEFVCRAVKNPNDVAGLARMYELMRDDLVSDKYSTFKNLKLDTVLLPDPLSTNKGYGQSEAQLGTASQQRAAPLPTAPGTGPSEGAR